MARIVEKNDQIQLFLIAAVPTPLESDNNGLRIKTPDLYTLMRTGRVSVPSEHEYVLGLKMDTNLLPTFWERVESLNTSAEDDLKYMGFKHNILGKVNQCPVYEEVSKGIPAYNKTRRIAVLVSTKTIRELAFSLNDGFGVPIEKAVIAEMRSKLKAKLKRESKLVQIKSIRGIKVKNLIGFRIKGTAFATSISDKGLNVEFHSDMEILEFLTKASTVFGKKLADERLQAVKEAGMVRYG